MPNQNFTSFLSGNYRIICRPSSCSIQFEQYNQDQGWLPCSGHPFFEPKDDTHRLSFWLSLVKAIEVHGPLSSSFNGNTFKCISTGSCLYFYKKEHDSLGEPCWINCGYNEIPMVNLFGIFCKLGGFIPVLIFRPLEQEIEEMLDDDPEGLSMADPDR